ncbi:MAG: hypothetical protein ACRDGL_05295 [Candidatus Limnocylindrales bacterium]
MAANDLSRILRVVLGILGAVSLLGGLLLATSGGSVAVTAFWPIVVGIVLVIVALYEHGRYRAGQGVPGPDGGASGVARPGQFERTEEIFTDPTSGQLTRVWYDPTTGQREYRPEQ